MFDLGEALMNCCMLIAVFFVVPYCGSLCNGSGSMGLWNIFCLIWFKASRVCTFDSRYFFRSRGV